MIRCIVEKETLDAVGIFRLKLQEKDGYAFYVTWCEDCTMCEAGLDWYSARCRSCQIIYEIRKNLVPSDVENVYYNGYKVWYKGCKRCDHGEVYNGSGRYASKVQCSDCKQMYHESLKKKYPVKATIISALHACTVYLYSKPEEKHKNDANFKWVKRTKNHKDTISYIDYEPVKKCTVRVYVQKPSETVWLDTFDARSLEHAQEIVASNGVSLKNYWV